MLYNKVLFAGFCIALLSCSGSRQSDEVKIKSDYERLNLKAKVKTIVETYYIPVISGDTVKCGERTSSISSFINDEAFSSYETKVRFNTDGNVVECLIDSPETGFQFKETCEYAGKLLTVKQGLLSDNFFYRQEFTYDTKNREIRRVFYNREDRVFESIEVEYPSPDAIVEKITADGDVRFVRQIKLKDGLQVEAVTRTDSAQSINRWTNEYTDSGQVSLSYFYDDIDDAVQYARYAYDEHGNETACWLYNGYDDQLISEVQRQYKYDINGNWTLQTLFTDKYAEVVTVRTITYY